MPHIIRSLAVACAIAGAALLAWGAQHRVVAHSDGHATRGGHGHAFAAGEPGDPKKTTRRVIEIVMSEGPGTMTFSPDRIEVRKGEQVRFVLKNIGELRHEFLIDSFENNAKHKTAMEKSPGMEHAEPNGRHVEPKQSAEVLWRFTSAGTFEFACFIPGHYETGMKGIVVVK